jgi:hypothetical protein
MPAWKRDLLLNFSQTLKLDILVAEASDQPAWTNVTAQGSAVIDYLMISSTFPQHQTFHTEITPTLTTTHRLIHSQVIIHANTPLSPPPSPKYNTKKLKQLPILINYIIHAEKLHEPLLEDLYLTLEPILATDINGSSVISDLDAQQLINIAFSKIISVITDSADTIPGKHLPCSPLIDPLWDRELRHLIKTRSKLAQDLSRTQRQTPLHAALKDQLALADKTFKRKFRAKKRSGFKSWSHGLQHQSSTDTVRIISQIIRSRQRRSAQSTLTSEDLELSRDHWKNTATDLNLHQHPEPQPQPLSSVPQVHTQPDFSISIQQIETAINETPINKAPGPDGIVEKGQS